MRRAVDDDWKQEVWRGSLDEFADLLIRVRRLVPSGGVADPPVTVRVARGGNDLVFEDGAEFDDFARGGARPLLEARRVTATVGQLSSVRAELEFERTRWPGMPGVSAKFNGEDPVTVNGVSAEARRLVEANGWPIRTSRAALVAWGLGVVVASLSVIHTSAATALWWGGVSLLAIGWLGGWFLVPVLFPRFELFDPSAPDTATIVVRRWIAGVGKWFLAAVAGAAIYAVIDHLI